MRPPALLLLLSFAIACGNTTTNDTTVHGLFEVKPLDQLSEETFLDLPWPLETRRDADQTIHMVGLPNPNKNYLVRTYIDATKGLLHGFSTVAAQYFRFSGNFSSSNLPTSADASVAIDSTVQIINVDHRSPEFGRHHPARVLYRQSPGVYWLSHTIAVLPELGQPLLPNTRYVTLVRGLRGTDGVPVRQSNDLSSIFGLRTPASEAVAAVATALAPYVNALLELGTPLGDVSNFAAYTTADPAAELFLVRDYVRSSFPAPAVLPETWAKKDSAANYDVYEGLYGPSPNFQVGVPPYWAQGGNFAIGADGVPVVQNTFNPRFVIAVPKADKCPEPPDGYPIVIYAHGTGGNYRSVVGENHGVADEMAPLCIAAIGVDQIFHGTRPGAPDPNDPRAESDTELAFFNLQNPITARTNARQSAIDVVQESRLFSETHVFIPAAISTTTDIHFNGANLTFFGHSQGGINGPLFLAADDLSRGGVLSGTGAMLSLSLLEKTQPSPSVAGIVKAFLDLYKEQDALELSEFHPALNLAETIVEATDPAVYMPYIIQRPRPGFAPKSILQTEGVTADGTGDHYTPPHAIETGAIAMGLPILTPSLHPFENPFGTLNLPDEGLSGNLANGQATGVLAQFTPQNGDGHFVVFEVPAARALAHNFIKALTVDPKGRLSF